MIIDIQCNSNMLNDVLYAAKNILNLIMIIAPILAIISFTILLIKMTLNPDDKKIIKNLGNAVKALIIIFFIPLFVNVVMGILGESNQFSSCYNNATKRSGNTTYVNPNDTEKKSKIGTEDVYERGEPKQLAFNCKSQVIKSQFSCDTLHRVAAHYKDFNYYTFDSFMSNKGGFQNYVDEVGGFFKEYYGKRPKVKTVLEFQKISEYVFGFLYMYGVDYFNGKNPEDEGKKYCKWGGACLFYKAEAEAIRENRANEIVYPTGTDDAFYPGQMRFDNNGLSPSANFDKMVSNGYNITTNCNWTVDMVFYKAGIFGTGRTKVNASSMYSEQVAHYPIVTDFKDLQVGDILHFFNHEVDSSNPSTWSGWKHVAYVGEVNKKKGTVTAYDGGSYFTINRNHKWTFNRNKTTKSLGGFPGWGAVHIIDLK